MDAIALRDELVEWLKQHITQAGAKGAVVGLSGGIDSAVVMALCNLAFPHNTLGVMMPCDSDPIDLQYAAEHAKQEQVRTVTVDLTSTWKHMISVIDAVCESQAADADTLRGIQANVKPRLRMTTLYYIAAQHNYLVVGTENLPEIMLGYSTKYGDAGVDLMPLANLLKREVRALAAVLNVPCNIIERTPTAGLWHGQTDEQEMGLNYEEIDCFLSSGEGSERVKQVIDTLQRRSAHKRNMPPRGPAPKR